MLSVKDSRIPGNHLQRAGKLSDNSIIFHARHPNSPSTQEIPGNPDLITHGEMTVSDGGLTFDGQDSHAVAQIAPDDCVINPEQCADGLSFGMKLKFDKLGEEAEPRYIVDTGAHEQSMRGFSLYTKRDNLVALLRTADREWTVSFINVSLMNTLLVSITVVLNSVLSDWSSLNKDYKMRVQTWRGLFFYQLEVYTVCYTNTLINQWLQIYKI